MRLTPLGWLVAAGLCVGCASGRPTPDPKAETARDASAEPLGAGGTTEPEPAPDASGYLAAAGAAGEADDAAPTPLSWPGPITVPVRPRWQATLNPFDLPFSEGVHNDDGFSIVLARSVPLAVGEGYSSTLTVYLPEQQLGGNAQWFGGKVTLSEVTGGTGAISARVTPNSGVEISVVAPGTAQLVARGTITITEATAFAAAGAHPFELRLLVDAFRPGGASFVVPSACSAAATKRVAVAQQMRGDDDRVAGIPTFRVFPLDGAGNSTVVWNAEPEAQLAVRINGPGADAGTEGTRLRSIEELVFPAVPSEVTFTPEVGEPLEVEVVDASAVSRLDVAFFLAGTAGGPTPLVSGGSIEPHRNFNRVAPMVSDTYVGQDALCSPPAPTWFEISTSSPDVCSVLPLEPNYDEFCELWGLSLGRAAQIIVPGTCSLTLRAPQLLGGKGFSLAVSTEFKTVPRDL